MIINITIRNFIFIFLIAVDSNVQAQNWKGPYYALGATGTGAENGNYFESAIVNEHPAIAYTDETHKNIMFIRALDNNGTIWGEPIIVDTFSVSGIGISMIVVNGNPAIVYSGGGTSGYAQLRYKRAIDLNGTTWNPAVVIDSNAVGNGISMIKVNGVPAVAYSSGITRVLRYVRAANASGTAWSSSVLVDSSGYQCNSPVMKIANGNPAIGYYNGTDRDLMFVRSLNTNGTSWGTVDTVQSANDVGTPFDMEIINGNPAFAYYFLAGTEFDYIRATDANGSAWGNPVLLDPFVGSEGVSLHNINGFPAVTFSSAAANDFYYMRATDADGTAWGTLIPVGNTGQVLTSKNKLTFLNGRPKILFRQYNPVSFYFQGAADSLGNNWNTPVQIQNRGATGKFSSLKIVRGWPAYSFYDSAFADLCYVRASDTSGLIPWQQPVVADPENGSGYGNKLEIVNGRPAIAYLNNNVFKLKFVRAANATGTAWGTPVVLDFINIPNPVFNFVSLAVVNDTPAVSYYNPSTGHLMFIRANDPDGVSWSTPVVVDSIDDNGKYNSIVEVNSRPAIAYYNSTTLTLKYVRATNGSGNMWGTPLTLNSSGDVGKEASMCLVHGFPAIAASGLYYLAADSNGTVWNNPVAIPGGQLTMADGKPTVAAVGLTVVYCRALDNYGTVWGTPETVYVGQGSFISLAGNAYKSYLVYYNYTETTALYFSKTLACTPPNATITASGPTAFCTGDSVVLNVPFSANNNYQWLKGGIPVSGAVNSSYTVTSGGYYKVFVTNMLTGCTKTSPVTVPVTVYTLPVATITPLGSTTFCAGDSVVLKANSGAGFIYQWRKNGINISGATNINYSATSAGIYKARVTNAHGCSRISTGITVTVPCRMEESEISFENENLFDATVFPNPSSGDFVFEIINPGDYKSSLNVYDMVGKKVDVEPLKISDYKFQISNLPPGVFSAIIVNGTNSKILKLVKIK